MQRPGRAALEKSRIQDHASANVDSQTSGPSAQLVRAELEKIVSSPVFITAEALRRFLRYIVDQTLEGNARWIKESVLGVEVFGRGESFDPRLDPIVRVDARRLRGKLAEYYEGEGRQDPVVIEVLK